jgi:transcription elongation factor Elf1
MPIHHLHEPIDVFSEWLDDCEAAERGEVAAAAPSSSNSRNRGNMSKVVHDTSQDYSDDDSEGLPEASGFSTTAATAATSGQKRSAAENEDEGSDNEEEGGGKKQKATTATLGLDESDDDSD